MVEIRIIKARSNDPPDSVAFKRVQPDLLTEDFFLIDATLGIASHHREKRRNEDIV